MHNISISILYQGMLLTGYAQPLETLQDVVPSILLIYIQGWYLGRLSYCDSKWSMDQPIDPKFIEALGGYIQSHIQSLTKAMNYKRADADN